MCSRVSGRFAGRDQRGRLEPDRAERSDRHPAEPVAHLAPASKIFGGSTLGQGWWRRVAPRGTSYTSRGVRGGISSALVQQNDDAELEVLRAVAWLRLAAGSAELARR